MVHVAVGLIFHPSENQILIAKRHDDAHQGGLWEFPGGKVEAGETVDAALSRELKEELGIDVLTSKAALQISHQYNDKNVLLDVWTVEKFDGQAIGAEGQPVKWLALDQLQEYQFPEANKAIVQLLIDNRL